MTDTQVALAGGTPKGKLLAQVTLDDGRVINLGRVDRKWWAPRLWFYKYVTYPKRKRALANG